MRKTSRAAYDYIVASGIISERRTQAYTCLFKYGPMTAMEATFQAKIPGLWKRFSELRDVGLAEEIGLKTCTVTGRDVIAWDVTDYNPKKQGLLPFDKEDR